MQPPQNAYIHIPFCNSKCFYCAFVSTVNTKLELGYLIALLKEIDTNYQGNALKTLYFGGGTPSIMPLEHVKKIFNKFYLEDNAEITFELNPENATLEYFKGLKEIGINRLSIGIQTFNDEILKQIGRRHTSEQAKLAVNLAQKAEFDNISLDFIYGLPNQTLKDFEKDLEIAKTLNIQHVSLYGLKIEENSVYGKKLPSNLPDDDLQADMYLKAIEVLNDFNHYEISNFAKNGYDSKHNLNYWNNNQYYGFGCGAHGYENGMRYANCFDIHKYMENPLTKDFGHFETQKEKLEEEIFLGFRRACGINISEINSKFNIDFEKKYQNTLKKYLETGHLKRTNDGYALTNEGFLISTVILAEFI